MLARLVAPMDTPRAAGVLMGYLPLLDDFSDAAFTVESLKAVAGAERRIFVPSFDEVQRPLRAWWRENRPYQTALPAPRAPNPVPPSVEVVQAVSAKMTAWRAEVAAREPASLPVEPMRARSHCASDGVLMAIYEAQLCEGGPGSEVASVRLGMLRAKIAQFAGDERRAS